MRRKIVEAKRNGDELTDEQQMSYDNMTDRQRNGVDKDSEMTPLQASFHRLEDSNLNKSIDVWSKATDDERYELRDIYEARIQSYIKTHNLEGEELSALQEKIDNAENRQ